MARLLLINLFLLNSCFTVNPRIDKNVIKKCFDKCRLSKSLRQIETEFQFSFFYLQGTIDSYVCICENDRKFYYDPKLGVIND